MKLHPLRSSRRPSAAADVQSWSSVNTRWHHCCLSVQSSTTFNLPVNVSLRRSLWRHHIQLMVKFWLRLMPRSWTCRTCNHTEAVLNLRPQKSNERTTPCPRPPSPTPLLPCSWVSHLVVCVGEQCILGVHQDSAGLLLQPIEGGGLHRDVRGLLVTVKDLGGHHVLQDKTTVTRSRLSQDRVVGVIIFNGVRVKKKKRTWATLKTM